MMLKDAFSTIKAKKGVLALEAITPPNAIKRADYTARVGNNTVVHRVFIELCRDGRYLVREFKYNLPRSTQPIVKMSYKTFKYDFQAVEKFNEVCEFLSISDYHCISSKSTPIVNLFENSFYKNRISGVNISKYKKVYEDVVQVLSGGIHCYLKINHFGDIALHEINHINEPIDSKSIITPYIKCFADSLIAQKDFRGAIIEGFATKDAFDIIDAGFIGTQDLRQMSLLDRLSIIPNLIGDNPSKYGVSFLRPVTTVKLKSAIGYLLVRSNSNSFSLTNDQGFTHCIYSLVNVIELEAIELIKGNIHCYYTDNENLTYNFAYINDAHTVSMESYTLSESPNYLPIIF
jgi:hypothetical protein